MQRSTPHDFATFVYGRLDTQELGPSLEDLDTLFQTLFLTSLKTEEGTPITCSVAYVNPRNPDPEPPRTIRDPRWRYTPLETPLEFNVAELSKVALAADGSTCALAVYTDRKGGLKIWGLIDQQAGFQSMLVHENHGCWEPPGPVQAQIVGFGHIAARKGLATIGELNADVLVEGAVDVFDGTLVRAKLEGGLTRRHDHIVERANALGCEGRVVPKGGTRARWFAQICRILIRAKALAHGGAFVLTDTAPSDRIAIRYKIQYDRLPTLFENWSVAKLVEAEAREEIRAAAHGEVEKLYAEQIHARNQAEDAAEAISGALDVIAGLSRVDGLVLMDTNLTVHGFGCEIIASGAEGVPAYEATRPSPATGAKPLDIRRFGTRHRSMIRYCSEDPLAVGFVVSADGFVRAVSGTGKRVYLWDNIQLTYSIPLRHE